MMKKLFTILYLTLCTFSVYAQNNVFVLVDVSGSGDNDIKLEAKNQVYGLLSGNYSTNGWAADKISDNLILNIVNSPSGNGLVKQNSWFSLMSFGNKDTYKQYKIVKNQNHPRDYQSLFNTHYPSQFHDGYTFSQIAEAFTVSLAKTYNINEYYIIIVTDDLDDKGNTKSMNPYDSFEKDLLMSYGNESSSIVKNIGTLIKNNYYIKFRKVTNVGSTTIKPAPGVILPPPTDTDNAIISLTSPPKARKGKEHEIKTESLNINWTCKNCPQGIKYTVMVSQYDGGKFKETKKDITINSATFKVPDGKFRITVSASNYLASSDFTHISVSTGSYGWLLFLVILLAAGATGYYFWNKKRQEKIDEFSTNKLEDIFSNGNGNTTSNSSNSDYF